MSIVVALAIAGVLLTIAIPSMLDQVARGQIKEALALASVARKPIDAAWSLGAALPADNASAGLPAADRIVSNTVSAVRVENGAIHLTLGNKISGALAGKVVSMRPAVVAGENAVPIAWVCGHASAPPPMTLMGADHTDVDVRLLPFECKADA